MSSRDSALVERIRRAEALFVWVRNYLARSTRAARGPMSDDDLKWEIALRQCGADPATRRWAVWCVRGGSGGPDAQ